MKMKLRLLYHPFLNSQSRHHTRCLPTGNNMSSDMLVTMIYLSQQESNTAIGRDMCFVSLHEWARVAATWIRLSPLPPHWDRGLRNTSKILTQTIQHDGAASGDGRGLTIGARCPNAYQNYSCVLGQRSPYQSEEPSPRHMQRPHCSIPKAKFCRLTIGQQTAVLLIDTLTTTSSIPKGSPTRCWPQASRRPAQSSICAGLATARQHMPRIHGVVRL